MNHVNLYGICVCISTKLSFLNSSMPYILAPDSTDDGWNEDWGDWEEDKSEPQESRDTTPDTDQEGETTTNQALKWLQTCSLSVSPAADLLAIANEDRLVLMARQY